jgi:hypothetical protein
MQRSLREILPSQIGKENLIAGAWLIVSGLDSDGPKGTRPFPEPVHGRVPKIPIRVSAYRTDGKASRLVTEPEQGY